MNTRDAGVGRARIGSGRRLTGLPRGIDVRGAESDRIWHCSPSLQAIEEACDLAIVFQLL
jgi:hypothetical protein